MSLAITAELIQKLNKAAVAWKKEPESDDKHEYFDVKCEEEFGLRVRFSGVVGKVTVEDAEIIDDEKYIWFLLRFGSDE